jgi:hypothetical protein
MSQVNIVYQTEVMIFYVDFKLKQRLNAKSSTLFKWLQQFPILGGGEGSATPN